MQKSDGINLYLTFKTFKLSSTLHYILLDNIMPEMYNQIIVKLYEVRCSLQKSLVTKKRIICSLSTNENIIKVQFLEYFS